MSQKLYNVTTALPELMFVPLIALLSLLPKHTVKCFVLLPVIDGDMQQRVDSTAHMLSLSLLC